MKYHIKTVTPVDNFKPFSITLTFETKEEYVRFHDDVMPKITGAKQHTFHGNVFRAGNGQIGEVKGRINFGIDTD